jgi:hypothetical protein
MLPLGRDRAMSSESHVSLHVALKGISKMGGPRHPGVCGQGVQV